MLFKCFFIVFFCFLLLSSCVKKACRISNGYEFELPVTLSPAQSSYHIGDTITISSIFSDEVYERRTDQQYTLEEFSFFPEIVITDLVDTSIKEMFVGYFDVIIDSAFNFYHFEPVIGINYFEYNYTNQTYHLAYKIIPKQEGLFAFSHVSRLGIFGKGQEFDGKCRSVDITTTRTALNGSTDNNIHLLSESPNPHYNDWILQRPDERFHKFGSFAFRVVE